MVDSNVNNDDFTQVFNQTLCDGFHDGYYIGVMSGTSLDGMDVAVAQFGQDGENGQTTVNLVATYTKDFHPILKQVLLALCQPNGISNLPKLLISMQTEILENDYIDLSIDEFQYHEMSELDWYGWASQVYSKFVSKVITELLEIAKIDSDEILAIGCHGQTVRHRPQYGFTLQLIDPNIIAEFTGISVVSDFRRRDMAVGGQGAPLVPAFHKAIFAHPSKTRVLLNLGGIANITILSDSGVIGYDTGPANLLIDVWAQSHTAYEYDINGQFARSGTVINQLLYQLLEHPYFQLSAPKSTGREDFNLVWLSNELDRFSFDYPDLSYSPADVQATLTELTAIATSNEIIKYASAGSVFVCGGGAYNSYLLDRLQSLLPNDWNVDTTDSLGIAPTWIESIAFAWLARQTMLGNTGNMPEVTGAKKSVVLGQLCV